MAAHVPANSRMRPVTFRTEDGWHICGSAWDARVAGAVWIVLLHDHGANRTVWEPYVGYFLSRGWSVLTFDLRGHGESVRHDTQSTLLPEASASALENGWPLDVRAALAFLRAEPSTAKCAVVGVGLGADLAYASATRDWGAGGIVAVSPNDERARRFAGAGTFEPRAASLMYAALDQTGNAAALAFASCAHPPAECHAYEGSSAMGMALWNERRPDIVARAIAWIERVG